MHKFIRNNQRKFVAVFGVGLMITFIASTGSSYFAGSGGGNDPIVGHMGDDAVHAAELGAAQREWKMLRQIRLGNMGTQADQTVPALAVLGDGATLIDRDPDVFLLLQKEADKLGMVAPADGVEELMHNQQTLGADASPDAVRQMRVAFEALLRVKMAAERAASVVKISQPQIMNNLALLGQSITLQYAAFDSSEFKANLPQPTPDQLQTQFTKYANTLPGQPTDDNPFGFGYEYPNREKVEYLSLRKDDLRAAVRKGKDQATWEIEARKQYIRHPTDYPTSRPAGTSSLSPYVAASQPTTKPLGFDDYREQIINELVDAAVDGLSTEVQAKITTTIESDWLAYHAVLPNGPSTAPSTQPMAIAPISSVGVPYDSDQYLAKLSGVVQAQFNVTPQVNRFVKDWLTENDLAGLPGIGGASISGSDSRQQPLAFPQYAIGYLDVFGHTPSQQDVATMLSVLAPSTALTDSAGNVHYFRIVAAETAHAPASMAEVADQVHTDVLAAAAMKQTRDQAAEALKLSAQSKGFTAAVAAIGRKVLIAGPIFAGRSTPTPDLTLKPQSSGQLNRAAFDLLKQGDAAASGKSINIIELPMDGKVLVATITGVKPVYDLKSQYLAEATLQHQAYQTVDRDLRILWFDPTDIRKRTAYTEVKKKPNS